ncbi:MAG: hypothetical protein K8R21_10375, partial [Leptospira sp.]|nr:hypothetical protein [Leptospira sp.]
MFRKNFLLISVLLFITNYTVQFAQDKEGLSEREVKASRKIQFQNRSTLRADQETKQEDIEIGKKISELIEKTPGKTQTYKDISIVRIPVKEEGKFGGDIVTIGKSSTIGHINSLVRILSALIQNSFQYKESDADILALYVLYYNAMHRGDKKYFSKKYNADLNSSLTEAKTGIAVSYKNWPGKT